MNRLILVLTFLISSFFGTSYAQDKTSYIEEEQLKLRAYYYDAFDDALLPVMNPDDNYETTYLILDGDKVLKKKVRFQRADGLSLFINGQLYQEYTDSGVVELDLSSLFNSQKRQILVFHKKGGYSLNNAVLLGELNNSNYGRIVIDGYGLLDREIPRRSQVYVLLILVFGVFAYFRFIHSQYLYAYFDLTKMFSRQGVEEYILLHPFTGQSLVLMFACSLLYALGAIEGEFIKINVVDSAPLLNVLLLGVLLFFLFFVKQLYLYFLNYVFGQKKLVKNHFFEYARFYNLFSVLFFVVSFSAIFLVKWVFWFVLCFWLIWLIIILIRRSNLRKMYLISYLCASEIFPLVLVFKIGGVI